MKPTILRSLAPCRTNACTDVVIPLELPLVKEQVALEGHREWQRETEIVEFVLPTAHEWKVAEKFLIDTTRITGAKASLSLGAGRFSPAARILGRCHSVHVVFR